MIIYLLGDDAGRQTAVLQHSEHHRDQTHQRPQKIINKPQIPSYNSAFCKPKPWKPSNVPHSNNGTDSSIYDEGYYYSDTGSNELVESVDFIPIVDQKSQRAEDVGLELLERAAGASKHDVVSNYGQVKYLTNDTNGR